MKDTNKEKACEVFEEHSEEIIDVIIKMVKTDTETENNYIFKNFSDYGKEI